MVEPFPSQALSLLTCPRCGAGVSVTREETTQCAYCRHDVTVPAAHREALILAEREVEADALTREAFHALGAPPSWPLRAIGGFSTGCAGAVAIVVVSFGASINLSTWLLNHGEAWFRVNAWDWFSGAERELLGWGSGFFLMAALFAFGVFGRRKAANLQRLQQALSARPPPRAGGPALCRQCGAPLSVPPDARGVRCAYCRTDNLVAVPEKWLASKKRFTSAVTHEAKGALHVQRRELRRLRIDLALRLSIIVLLATLVLGSTVRRVFNGSTSSFDLRRRLAEPRELFDVMSRATLLGTPTPPVPTIPVDQCASEYVLHPGQDIRCIDQDCFGGWFVALRAGETLTFSPEGSGSARFFSHIGSRTWTSAYGKSELWGEQIAEQPLAPRTPARFRAPLTNWYRVDLELHDVRDDISVCAKIQ